MVRDCVVASLPLTRHDAQVHESVFIGCLRSQCSDEQAAEWLPKALNYEILGCYAQTELGHGSNVRGIETTATYLPESDEFELHTPCLSATKWWIGGLGKVLYPPHQMYRSQCTAATDS